MSLWLLAPKVQLEQMMPKAQLRTSEFGKRFLYCHTFLNFFLDFFISLYQLRRQLDDSVQLVLWDNDYALDWVAKDDITLWIIRQLRKISKP